MEENCLISVIIPVYKVEEYLERCLQSVCAQTYKNLEIIVVDDGSPDRCGEMAEAFAKNDTRIKVFHKENGGLSDARNYGIKQAAGDWYCFVDSDDALPDNAIGLLLDAAIDHCTLMSMGGYYCHTYSGRVKTYIPSEAVLKGKSLIRFGLTTGKNMDYVWLRLYHKSLFEHLLFPVGKLYEDTRTTVKYMHFAKKCAIISEPVYHYYMRMGSICSSTDLAKRLELIEAVEEKQRFVCEKYPQYAPYAYDLLIESYCNGLWKMDEVGYRNCRKEYVALCRKFRDALTKQSKKSLKVRLSVSLFQISPKLLGKLVRLYAYMQRH